MKHLRVAYLLEDTALAGGVRVVAAQADALIARGHHAAIVTPGSELTWRASSAEWILVNDFSELDASRFDFVIATFWTTIEPAFALAGPRAIHFSQGYEGGFTVYQPVKPQIDAAYRLIKPKIVVSPHLIEVCRPFSEDVVSVGQIVDEDFFQSGAGGNERPRVLLAGPQEMDTKGIDAGYDAAAHARFSGAEFDLVRVSPWRPSGAEPLESVAEFHVGLNTAAIVRLLLTCDAMLAPTKKEEGFGLPAAEALASGIPIVMTRIPSYLGFDSRHDYAMFADEDDAEALGDGLVELLDDSDLRHALILRGREVAEQFRSEHVGRRLEEYLLARRAR